MTRTAKPIWIATGGTAGHIFPALAVADELTARRCRLIISSDGRGMKYVRDYAAGNAAARPAFVWASGVGAKNALFKILSLVKMAATTAALAIRFLFSRPARIVAFGGYSSVPVLIAGRMWRIPTFLHEQNAAIGRANKFAMPFVRTLMTSFPIGCGVHTGLPVRKDIRDAKRDPAPKPEPRLLVMGGSLGAAILDDVVPRAVAELKRKVFVIHQTRPENVEKVRKAYAGYGIKNNVLSFIRDVAGEMSAATLVVCRAGASTVAEMQTIGVPAVLVPLGINPDQLANAKAFAKNGGGGVMEQRDLDATMLAKTLGGLLWNPGKLAKMAAAAYVENDAAKRIADTILDN